MKVPCHQTYLLTYNQAIFNGGLPQTWGWHGSLGYVASGFKRLARASGSLQQDLGDSVTSQHSQNLRFTQKQLVSRLHAAYESLGVDCNHEVTDNPQLTALVKKFCSNFERHVSDLVVRDLGREIRASKVKQDRASRKKGSHWVVPPSVRPWGFLCFASYVMSKVAWIFVDEAMVKNKHPKRSSSHDLSSLVTRGLGSPSTRRMRRGMGSPDLRWAHSL